MLEDIFFRPFHFAAGKMLRGSLLINSILLNSEVWYGITKADINELEAVDHSLLRKILQAPSCTPTPMLYLELGCIPIRRLMCLQYLLQE
jgi:hypothetical protein